MRRSQASPWTSWRTTTSYPAQAASSTGSAKPPVARRSAPGSPTTPIQSAPSVSAGSAQRYQHTPPLPVPTKRAFMRTAASSSSSNARRPSAGRSTAPDDVVVDGDGTWLVDARAAGGERAQAEVEVASATVLVEAAERDERVVADQGQRRADRAHRGLEARGQVGGPEQHPRHEAAVELGVLVAAVLERAVGEQQPAADDVAAARRRSASSQPGSSGSTSWWTTTASAPTPSAMARPALAAAANEARPVEAQQLVRELRADRRQLVAAAGGRGVDHDRRHARRRAPERDEAAAEQLGVVPVAQAGGDHGEDGHVPVFGAARQRFNDDGRPGGRPHAERNRCFY